MPKYPKNKKNVPFNGITSIRYDSGYVLNKIVFKVHNTTSLLAIFYSGNRKCETIEVKNFKDKTALDVLNKYTELGRHFEDGILEIYHYLEIPLGYVVPILREWR